jgi:hypothetical protein
VRDWFVYQRLNAPTCQVSPTYKEQLMNTHKRWRFLLLAHVFVVFSLAACDHETMGHRAQPFKVTVIVDTLTDPVSRDQAGAILAIANEKLIDLTGIGLQLHEFMEDDSGGSIADIVENYMVRESDLPSGVLVFSVGDDDRAKINRAYAQQILAPAGFKNTFVSPYLGDEYMYVAVLQFNYRYAACGYGGGDTIQSQVSSNGECGVEDGQACAEWNGMQVCPAALPFLEGQTPVTMAVSPLIHEYMHAFGDKGQDDHYASAACQETLGREPDYYNFEESEYYNDFCPPVYGVFADSYQP